MNDKKIIAHYHLVNNLSNDLYNKQHEIDLDLSNPLDVAKAVIDLGYRKESDTVKEVLGKVLKFTLDDEVGMRYLIKNLAKEYGVELK